MKGWRGSTDNTGTMSDSLNRMMRGHRWEVAAAVIIGVLALVVVQGVVFGQATMPTTAPEGAGNPGNPEISGGAGVSLPSLQRVVRHFDFEEAEEFPIEMPLNFVQILTNEPGHALGDNKEQTGNPPGFLGFGTMQLRNDESTSGRWSFRFDLNGGSMAARITRGVIPVLPGSDYRVSINTRTKGLKYSRVRMAAWLNDVKGIPIPRSRVESTPRQTHGAWTTIDLEVVGDFDDAADLVVELQLVQPRHFDSRMGEENRPIGEDIHGTAWFDDLIIRNIPRIELSTTTPGNLFIGPDHPALSIRVQDIARQPLAMRLRILDLNGQVVHEISAPAPRARAAKNFTLPLGKFGWYAAVLDITGDGVFSEQRTLRFAYLPTPDSGMRSLNRRFGVVVLDPLIDACPDAPVKMSVLGVGDVVAPVWDASMDFENTEIHFAAQRQVLDDLLTRGLTVTFSLNSIPEGLARMQGLGSDRLLELFGLKVEVWKPYLVELLMNYGLEVPRWQIGMVGRGMSTGHDDMAAMMQKAMEQLGQFIPQFQPAWPLVMESDGRDFAPHGTRHFYVSHELSPNDMEAYVATWLEDGSDFALTLEPLPLDSFSPRQRVTDLAIRGLQAWRAGAPIIRIAAPWGPQIEGSANRQPTPSFPMWRTLAQHLKGRRVLGTMNVAEGVECWILGDEATDQGALVVWDSRLSSGAPGSLDALLASGPVTVVDLDGNARTIMPEEGRHHIPLGSAPVFIEGINPMLCLFHGGLTIRPDFIPTIAAVHEQEIVLNNPWSVAIGGTLRIVDDGGLHINPRVMSFSIRAGGEVRLPVAVETSRSMTAGMKRIEAEVSLSAENEYFLQLSDEVEVGLKTLKCTPVWRTALNPRTGRTDLVVGLTILNRGPRPVNLDVYLFAPEFPRLHKLIGGLRPGDTAIRSFYLDDGARRLSGSEIGVGVQERDGDARLNFSLDIPDGVGKMAVVTEPGRESTPEN